MKLNIFLALAMFVAITSAMNVTNETTSIHDELFVDEEDENFYSVDVLLLADDAFNAQIRLD